MSAPESKNELLGEVRCIEPGCTDGIEYVYINKRKMLYGICPECGTNQRTGKKVLERLAKFVPVGTLVRGEKSEEQHKTPEPEPEKKTDESAGIDQAAEELRGKSVERVQENKQSPRLLVVLGLAFAALVGVGLS